MAQRIISSRRLTDFTDLARNYSSNFVNAKVTITRGLGPHTFTFDDRFDVVVHFYPRQRGSLMLKQVFYLSKLCTDEMFQEHFFMALDDISYRAGFNQPRPHQFPLKTGLINLLSKLL